MQNIYETCYYGGLVLTILLLITTIVLFFVLKIPKVLGELTGSTARKGVKNLKEKGTKAKDTSEQGKHYSQRTGAIKTRKTESASGELSVKDNTTSKLSRTKGLKRKQSAGDETEFLGESKIKAAVTGDLSETAVLSATQEETKKTLAFSETGELSGRNDKQASDVKAEETVATENPGEEPTEVLGADFGDEPTEVLGSDPGEEPTEVLGSDSGEEPTEVLGSDSDDAPTEVLGSDPGDAPTEVLGADWDEEATDVLVGNGDFEETSVLTNQTVQNVNKGYMVLYNVLEVHSSESL